MKIKTILLMAIMTITISVVFTACGKTNVDIDSMLTISFTGSNGFGKPVFNTDISALEDIAADKDSETQIKYFAFLTSLKTTADKENLSNGDEITVTTTYNKEIADELGLNVINTETKVTVQGLEELKELKLSDIISIEYSGISPKASAIVDIKDDLSNLDISLTSEHPSVNTHEYGKYATSELKNGDTFTVKVQTDAEELAALGYVMPETEYTVTVEGLDEYIMDSNTLSADDIAKFDSLVLDFAKQLTDSYVVPEYQQMSLYYGYSTKTGATETMQAFSENNSFRNTAITKINKLELVKKTLNTLKDLSNSDNSDNPISSFFYIYKMEIDLATSSTTTEKHSGYIVFWAGQPVKLADESVALDNTKYSMLYSFPQDSISYHGSYKTLEEAIANSLDKNNENYDIVELDTNN